MRTRRLGAGAVAAALVVLHEHRVDLRQQRRLAGKPTFSDSVPFVPFALVVLAVLVYASYIRSGQYVAHVSTWPALAREDKTPSSPTGAR